MTPNLHALPARLESVSHRFIPPEQIKLTYRRGAFEIFQAPDSFLTNAISLSRINPVLSTAYAFGAYECCADLPQSVRNIYSLLALGAGLCKWGYFVEAYPLLAEVIEPLSFQVSPRIMLWARWHLLLCERRIHPVSRSLERLLEIANQLEVEGDSLNAERCRQDAVANYVFPSPDGVPERVLEGSQAYFATHRYYPDWAVGRVLLSYLYLNQGKLEQAHSVLQEAEAIFKREKMPTLLAYVWQRWAHYFWNQHKIAEAKRAFKRARRYAADLRHEFYLSQCLLAEFGLYYEVGDISTCSAILAMLRDLPSVQALHFVRGGTNTAAGGIALRLGHYEEAEAAYRQAELAYHEADQPALVAASRMNQGVVARRKGDFGASLRQLDEALQIFEASKDVDYYARTHHNLAKTYAAFGYFEPAIEHARQGITILKANGLGHQAVKASIFLARLLGERNQIPQALDLLNAALQHAKTTHLALDTAVADQVMAEIFRRENRYSEALTAYQHSIASLKSQRQQELVRESQLGIVETYVQLGDLNSASDTLRRLRRSRLPASMRWRYDWSAGRVSSLRGQSDRALHAYLNALMEMRDARRTLEREDQIEPFVLALQPLYEEAFGIAMERDQSLLALTFAELYGTQLLSVRMGRNISSINDPRELPDYVRRLLMDRVGSGWTILRYAWHQNNIWLFVINAHGIQCYYLPLDIQQADALQICVNPDDSFREFAYRGFSLTQRNALAMSQQARRQVLELLIPDSVRKSLSPDHLLIIVPAYKLHGLPFHALLDGNTPLIERATVLYAYSLEQVRVSLEHNNSHHFEIGQGLICGQSSFDETGYESLLHVSDEVNAIEHAVLTQPDLILGEHLTPAALTALYLSGQISRYDWLHFATHAYYDTATGAFTGLCLGKGRIEFSDIYRWNLRAKLVTLSACQTGIGKWYYGDEIAGLAQAFLSAGADAVTASLWRATDCRIAPLMAEFYARMQHGQQPSFALAQAQRQAHREGLDAYDWAPWAVFGHY